MVGPELRPAANESKKTGSLTMAKMFYTLQEAAEKLGVTDDEIRNLSSEGQLQVFRDRDKMMFKRDQVDGLAESTGAAAEPEAEKEADMSGTSIPLQETGETDALGIPAGDTAAATGINVFETDEVEAIDPKARTQMTESEGDDELMLESVGSGSGLLDLTRESDDTSLGAELLDEIYPGDSSADTKGASSEGSGSGAFDSAVEVEAAAEASGLAADPSAAALAVAFGDEAVYDPAGTGLTVGVLAVATACLIMALIVAIYAVTGVGSALTTAMSQSVVMCMGIMVAAVVVCGAVGYFIGKARE
jgi:excisionase family DNA binding protein